jgi:hypothetical protein
MDKNPRIKNGILSTPQKIQYPSGRYPSIMCIAFAAGPTINTANAKTNPRILFCVFFILFVLLSILKYVNNIK